MHLVNVDFKGVTGWQLRSKHGKTLYLSASITSKELGGTGNCGRELRRRQEETRAEIIPNYSTLIL
jgi:hypothetical protein